jgi:hypothetical protein
MATSVSQRRRRRLHGGLLSCGTSLSRTTLYVRLTVTLQEVEVVTYDKRNIKAFTLESSRGARHQDLESQHAWPSKRCSFSVHIKLHLYTHTFDRYVGLVLDGARHCKLDPDYVQKYIAAQPVCKTPVSLRLLAIVLAFCLVLPWFLPYYVAMRMGASTRYFHVTVGWLKALLWRIHDIAPVLTLVTLALLGGGFYYLAFHLVSLALLALYSCLSV